MKNVKQKPSEVCLLYLGLNGFPFVTSKFLKQFHLQITWIFGFFGGRWFWGFGQQILWFHQICSAAAATHRFCGPLWRCKGKRTHALPGSPSETARPVRVDRSTGRATPRKPLKVLIHWRLLLLEPRFMMIEVIRKLRSDKACMFFYGTRREFSKTHHKTSCSTAHIYKCRSSWRTCNMSFTCSMTWGFLTLQWSKVQTPRAPHYFSRRVDSLKIYLLQLSCFTIFHSWFTHGNPSRSAYTVGTNKDKTNTTTHNTTQEEVSWQVLNISPSYVSTSKK